MVPDLPQVWGDRERVYQVLLNLVNNAIKFSPPGAHMAIYIGKRSGDNYFAVTDDGPGIAAADLDRIFQRFTQLETGNTRSAAGTGLGLAVSKALVEAHGGEMGVESTPRVGSTFWFTLPQEPEAS